MDITVSQALNTTLYFVQVEKLITGIGLLLIAGILLVYLLSKSRMKSCYLLMIPLFTIFWGISGILAYFLNQDNAIYHESTHMEKLTLLIRLFSINIVHWIFVIKYYRTSLMLPKIFHDIMIDDFIEHGKFVTMSGSESG